MDRHPQPDPLLRAAPLVVLAQRRCQRHRQRFRKPALRDLRRSQDQHAIAAILTTTTSPPDASITERLLQRVPQAVAHSDLMRIGAACIPEPFNVHHDDGSVYRRTRMRHTTSRAKEPNTMSLPTRMPFPRHSRNTGEQQSLSS